jgi:hypothetical protein
MTVVLIAFIGYLGVQLLLQQPPSISVSTRRVRSATSPMRPPPTSPGPRSRGTVTVSDAAGHRSRRPPRATGRGASRSAHPRPERLPGLGDRPRHRQDSDQTICSSSASPSRSPGPDPSVIACRGRFVPERCHPGERQGRQSTQVGVSARTFGPAPGSKHHAKAPRRVGRVGLRRVLLHAIRAHDRKWQVTTRPQLPGKATTIVAGSPSPTRV